MEKPVRAINRLKAPILRNKKQSVSWRKKQRNKMERCVKGGNRMVCENMDNCIRTFKEFLEEIKKDVINESKVEGLYRLIEDEAKAMLDTINDVRRVGKYYHSLLDGVVEEKEDVEEQKSVEQETSIEEFV